MYTPQTITADEAVAQGLTPGSILSIARFNQRMGDINDSKPHRLAALKLRTLAYEVAGLTGIDMRAWRGRRAKAKTQKCRRAA